MTANGCRKKRDDQRESWFFYDLLGVRVHFFNSLNPLNFLLLVSPVAN